MGSAEAIAAIANVSELLVKSFAQGNKVMLFGNGGSAADAQHIAAEFVGRFAFDRPALPALALSVNSSALTAIGNDYGFDLVFARQIEALGRRGDMAIGISTSGNSLNVLRAMETAQKMGIHTVALVGCTGGKLKTAAEYCICAPSNRRRESKSATSSSDISLPTWLSRPFFMNRAAFLDRDGVINRKAPEGSYITSWEQMEFLPEVAEAIAQLNQAGFKVMVISNQRCVANGLLAEAELESIHQRMRDWLAGRGPKIDAVYYCPQEKTQPPCKCRKPAPGMLLRAARDHQLDLSASWMIGDSDSDVEAGRNAGCKTVRLVFPGKRPSMAAI